MIGRRDWRGSGSSVLHQTSCVSLSVAVFATIFAASFCNGCGGGSSTAPSPPPSPDFTLSISPSSVTIQQGTTSSGIQVSVQPVNGLSGTVQITLSSLRVGVDANPASPFTVQRGSSAMLLIGASATAATGNAAIIVN